MSEPPRLFKVEGFWPFTSASQEELGKPPITAIGYIDHCASWARYALERTGIQEPRSAASFAKAVKSVPPESLAAVALWLLNATRQARAEFLVFNQIAWDAHSHARSDADGNPGKADDTDRALANCASSLALHFAHLTHLLAVITTDLGQKGEGGILKPAQASKKSLVGASRGGKKSGATRTKYATEQAAKWKPHATALAKAGRAEQPGIPQDRLAWYVDQHWDQMQGGDKKSAKATTAFISELERAGIIPRKST